MDASRAGSITNAEIKQVDRLIEIFNETFGNTPHQTVLIRGQHEPLYRPQSHNQSMHQVVFAHGFFASALHEISHWCLAGAERRKLMDYGYWYQPLRNETEQAAFFQVEIKPQALEWVFTLAAGRRFFISADNLQAGGMEPTANWTTFASRVRQQTLQFLLEPLPLRAAIFAQRLFLEFYPAIQGPELWKNRILHDFYHQEDWISESN